jgi:hypothetical protein
MPVVVVMMMVVMVMVAMARVLDERRGLSPRRGKEAAH